MTRIVSAHLVALLMCGAAAPLLVACADCAREAAMHACCLHGDDLAPQVARADCCGMSAPADDVSAPDSQAPRPPAPVIRGRADLVRITFQPPSAVTLTAVPRTIRPASVPYYLQQRSLLI